MPTSTAHASAKTPPIRIFLIQSGSSVTNVNERPKSTDPCGAGSAVDIVASLSRNGDGASLAEAGTASTAPLGRGRRRRHERQQPQGGHRGERGPRPERDGCAEA